MKIAILESALGQATDKGHSDHFIDGTCEILAREDVSVEVYGRLAAGEQLSGPVAIRSCFSHSLYDQICDDPYDGRIVSFTQGSAQYAADLHAAVDIGTDVDLMLIPTATPRELAGLGLYLSQSKRKTKVAAIFHWGNSETLAAGGLESALLRQAGRAVQAAQPIDTWFGATHSDLAVGIAGPLGQPVHSLSSLTFFRGRPSDYECKPLPASGRPLRIGLLGAIRAAKGAALLDDIVMRLGKLDVPVELIVQAHGSTKLNIREVCPAVAVSVLPEWLEEGEMAALCASLDAAILPYDRTIYRYAVSGVFTLLSGHGVPCVVPNETWMSDRIHAGDAFGECFEGTGGASIASALIGLLERKVQVDQRQSSADAWRRKYDATATIKDIMAFAKG